MQFIVMNISTFLLWKHTLSISPLKLIRESLKFDIFWINLTSGNCIIAVWVLCFISTEYTKVLTKDVSTLLIHPKIWQGIEIPTLWNSPFIGSQFWGHRINCYVFPWQLQCMEQMNKYSQDFVNAFLQLFPCLSGHPTFFLS